MPHAAVAPPPPISARSAPERDLLLRCARLALSAEDAARVREMAIEGGIDWTALIGLGRRHGLIPFLHRHLHPLPLPAEAAAELSARYREGAHRTLRLAAELRRVLGALAAGGIDALPYKGPTLAVAAYGELSMRTFDDLDVLVRPEDAPRALAILAAEGYAPALHLSPAQDALFRRIDGDYPLVHAVSRTLVELHCRVSSLRFVMPLETAELMARARPVLLGGAEVPAPSAEDALLIACIHGCKHRWRRLEWVCTAAELLRGGSADLDLVLRRADELRARRTVLLGFALAREMLDAPLPPAVAAEIDGDSGIAMLAAEAERRMFAPDAAEMAGEDTAANLLYNLRARDGAADRARSAWRWLTLPTPEDWAWRRLPDPLFPLYRVLRPVRLLLRHGPRGRP
ncbi:MAG TPA: nucleotidyltransferase family protein [Longimicrobium sp.]|nr:nucleotidyltransferase family protein [Longimicrobium sp.]